MIRTIQMRIMKAGESSSEQEEAEKRLGTTAGIAPKS
jgi:hypothetical protein